jgi:hypothetical protein
MNQTDQKHQAPAAPRRPLSRSAQKSIVAAQKIIGDRATAIDQANVFSGPNPAMVGFVLAAVYLTIFFVTKINLVLLLVPLANYIRQPRNLVLADRGLALFRSNLLGRPTEFLGTYAGTDLETGEGETWLGFVKVQLGAGHVWIRTKDRNRLLAITPDSRPPFGHTTTLTGRRGSFRPR